MSFAWPVVLVALAAIPLLGLWYARRQRQRGAAMAAFLAPHMTPSALPHRPGWRRHVPMIVLALALAILILAAARPQRTVAVPVHGAAIMLANDVSSSMSATDVSPSRLRAAQRAAERFVAGVPGTVEVGQEQFARRPTVLQSPTTDHALIRAAIAQLRPGGGGTAIGDAIETALRLLTAERQNGKRLPGAIVLLSDGSSNVGVSPLAAARQAKTSHVPIYTLALGTSHGTIPIQRRGQTVTTPVPVSSQELAEVATLSGGRTFTAADSAHATAVYRHLAITLGHRHVKHELTAGVVGGGLIVLLAGAALSLWWFARIV